MSTHNIQFHNKIRKFLKMFVFLSYQKNFIGTQKQVQIIQNKRAIGVRVIKVLQFYCRFMGHAELTRVL